MDQIIKAGTTELTKADAVKIYNNNQFIVNYGGIYQPHYSTAQQQIYFTKIVNIKGIASRGRFYIMDAKSINAATGKTLVYED